MSFRYKLLLLAFFGTTLAIAWQELNQSYLHGGFPAKEGMLTSADEASYFAPARNFLEKGIWKDKSHSLSSYFQRTPGWRQWYTLPFYLQRMNEERYLTPLIPVALLLLSIQICSLFRPKTQTS